MHAEQFIILRAENFFFLHATIAVPSTVRVAASCRELRLCELFLDQIKVKKSIEEKRKDTAILLGLECPEL
ncbi:hypothetical protein EST38_g6015 [Candolleomyces aberdarensis]|uniref:Uncharacterized protein n=1 Tax=Candolleomyces aberdarensis TaxID=2316362 RepID=A0A4Q2DJ42_9AGAR|nr:hypothetical protein EST38_g6015 [Candolleomyces aberdarensis]